MGDLAPPALAAAVSNAGGLGSIGLSSATPESARDLVAQTRASTSRLFAVNYILSERALLDGASGVRWCGIDPRHRSGGGDREAAVDGVHRRIGGEGDRPSLRYQRPAGLFGRDGVKRRENR